MPVGLICLQCGETNLEGEGRCRHCRSPIGDFASSAPWEMGKAVPRGSGELADPRMKPVIFYGVWLYFGSSALAVFVFVFQDLVNLVRGGPAGDLSSTLAVTFLQLGYLALSVWALWSVSRRYFRRNEEGVGDVGE